MKLKPLQDWVLIQRIEPKEMTAAGIIIPDSAKDKPTEGIVLAIGPGKFKTEKGGAKEKEKEKKFIPTVLKPGQRIIYGKYSAREFEFDREMIVLVREEDVLGTVEETGAQRQAFLAARKEPRVINVAPSVQLKKSETPSSVRKKSLIKNAVTKKATVSKASERPVKKKGPHTKRVKAETPKAAGGKVRKKLAAKKSAAKKPAQKPLKKTIPLKKAKVAKKKAAIKKTTVKKTLKKKTELPKKKAVQKKASGAVSEKKVGTKKAGGLKKKQSTKSKSGSKR